MRQSWGAHGHGPRPAQCVAHLPAPGSPQSGLAYPSDMRRTSRVRTDQEGEGGAVDVEREEP